MTSRCSLVAAPALLLMLLSCGSPIVGPTAEDYARVGDPTIRPGESFRLPSEHHVTLSGDYGLPGGSYQVTFTCAGVVDYRIEDRNGLRNGRCETTGVSNSVTEPGVVGPGTLGIAIVRGTVDVRLR